MHGAGALVVAVSTAASARPRILSPQLGLVLLVASVAWFATVVRARGMGAMPGTMGLGLLNLASHSRIRNRTGSLRSAKARARLRACWVTHAPLGCAVTLARYSRRVSSSMKNST